MKIIITAVLLVMIFALKTEAQEISPLSLYLDKNGSLRYIDFYEDYQLLRIRTNGDLLSKSSNAREVTWGGQVTQVYFYGKYSYEIKYSFWKVEQITVRETNRVIVFDYFFNQVKSVYLQDDKNRKIVMKYFINDLENITGSIPGVSVFVDLAGN